MTTNTLKNIQDQIKGNLFSLNVTIDHSVDSNKNTEALERLENSSMKIGKAMHS